MAYIEQLVNADQSAVEELESLAIEGLESGPTEIAPGYREAKHRLLDARFGKPQSH